MFKLEVKLFNFLDFEEEKLDEEVREDFIKMKVVKEESRFFKKVRKFIYYKNL